MSQTLVAETSPFIALESGRPIDAEAVSELSLKMTTTTIVQD